MRATDDGFARARRALGQVDAEVDLARLRAVTAERERSGTDPVLPEDLVPPEESAAFGVEILRTGQRPALPRRRAAVWALAAAVALLCGAGVGVATLWSGPGEMPPGSQLPVSPGPQTSPEPDTSPTTAPRECPVPASVPSPSSGQTTADAPGSEVCSPSAAPSDPTDRVEP